MGSTFRVTETVTVKALRWNELGVFEDFKKSVKRHRNGRR